jgi:hypothetical protein
MPFPEELAADEEGDMVVHLNKEHAKVCLGAEDDANGPKWHMDTGESNHMTGNAIVFSELDQNVMGTVRFGDSSVVQIKGHETVVFIAHMIISVGSTSSRASACRSSLSGN